MALITGQARRDSQNSTLHCPLAVPLLASYLLRMAAALQTFIIPAAIGAVAIVLLMGLWNMGKGGSANVSQKLMRMRVLLQFIAILIIMVTIWMLGR